MGQSRSQLQRGFSGPASVLLAATSAVVPQARVAPPYIGLWPSGRARARGARNGVFDSRETDRRERDRPSAGGT